MAARKRPARQTEEQKEATLKQLSELLESAGDAPEGLENRNEDVKGFWPPLKAGGIYLTPLHYKLSDSGQDAQKASILVFGRLEKPRKLLTSDGKVVDGETGDLVAFWAKPGMREVVNCFGIRVWIEATGEQKDVGKGNPMWLYAVDGEPGAKGEKLPCSEDRRDKSKHAKHFFE